VSEKFTSIMVNSRKLSLALLALIVFGVPASAGEYYGARPLRYGNTGSWHFDARNDDRDFPNNGFFPGNFAANPWDASIGAAGFLESNPYRSALPYPSHVYFGSSGGQGACARQRSYLVKDGPRYACSRSVR